MAVLLCSCNSNTSSPEAASLIIKNGSIYTANDSQPNAKIIAVKDDIIIYVGDDESQIPKNDNTQVIDLNGKTLTPGFIEGHGHILGIGYNELNIDLLNVKNYDELLELVEDAVSKAEPGQWIVGRGWHQSKWTPQPEILVKGFQTHNNLSAISPDNPILLRHASGHASLPMPKPWKLQELLLQQKENYLKHLKKEKAVKSLSILTEIQQAYLLNAPLD